MTDVQHAQEFLHKQIPLTVHMGVGVLTLDPFTVEVPVALNSNHLGTAFGGSINAIATLAAYGFLWSQLHENAAVHIVIAESSIRFLRPARKIIRAICHKPAELEQFKRALSSGHRGRISLGVTVEENATVTAQFQGTFVGLSCAQGK